MTRILFAGLLATLIGCDGTMSEYGGPLEGQPALAISGVKPILPAALPIGRTGDEVELFRWTAPDDDRAEVVAVSYESFPFIDPAGPPGNNFVTGGPLVGIVEFGVGANQSRVEFDIPPGLAQSKSLIITDPLNTTRNGVSLAVPASFVIAYARNDARVNYPVAGAAGIGNPSPANVGAHLARLPIGRTLGKKLTRSLFFAGGLGLSAVFAVAETRSMFVPAFAKRVSFFRAPVQEPLAVTITSPFLNSYGFAVPAGTDGPFDISPENSAIINITNVGGAAMTALIAVFELEI